MAELGLAKVCELELAYVELATMKAEIVTIPVHVNVIPGDAAAGRIPNPTVRTELAYQQAQRAKQQAADALRSGDAPAASRLYGEASESLKFFAPDADPGMADEIADEARLLDDLSDRALHDDRGRVAKATEADRHLKARKRGRRPR